MAASAMMMLMLMQLPAAASVPFFVWGPTTIAAGLLIWLLPDTFGASMPETVQVWFAAATHGQESACMSKKLNIDAKSTLLGSSFVHDVCCSRHLFNDCNCVCSNGHGMQQAAAFTHAGALVE